MQKLTQLNEIQKRLPEGITIFDETTFDFTDDEYISMLCWIKFFRKHYIEHGKEKLPDIIFPIVSKRLRLDFGLYHRPDKMEKHVIYISVNGKSSDTSIKNLITTWQL